jgi:hypothetical protein
MINEKLCEEMFHKLCEAWNTGYPVPTLEQIQRVRDDVNQHFRIYEENMISITNNADISGKRKFMFADFKLEEDHGVTILKVYMDEDKKWNKLSKEKQNAVREFLEQHADELKPKHNAAVVLTFRDCGTEVHITFKQKQ